MIKTIYTAITTIVLISLSYLSLSDFHLEARVGEYVLETKFSFLISVYLVSILFFVFFIYMVHFLPTYTFKRKNICRKVFFSTLNGLALSKAGNLKKAEVYFNDVRKFLGRGKFLEVLDIRRHIEKGELDKALDIYIRNYNSELKEFSFLGLIDFLYKTGDIGKIGTYWNEIDLDYKNLINIKIIYLEKTRKFDKLKELLVILYKNRSKLEINIEEKLYTLFINEIKTAIRKKNIELIQETLSFYDKFLKDRRELVFFRSYYIFLKGEKNKSDKLLEENYKFSDFFNENSKIIDNIIKENDIDEVLRLLSGLKRGIVIDTIVRDHKIKSKFNDNIEELIENI